MEKYIVEVEWKKKISSKGNEYEGLFAILPNGKEILLSLQKVTYLTIRKYSK